MTSTATGAERPEALAAEKALVATSHKDSPEAVYTAFNDFCRTHFGTLDPLVYERFGNELKFNEAGQWRHVSENSATLAWETNLPAVSYVEYGPTTNYGQKTESTDRAYFLHIHALKNLAIDKTYHYRLVAVDARGKKLVSDDQIFETKAVAGAIRIVPSKDGAPIKLEKSGKYILTADLTAPGTAIITLRDNITLDLNGYTITFGQDATTGKDVAGVNAIGTHKDGATPYHSTGLKLLNGTIRQGTGKLMDDNKESLAFNAVRITGKDLEIAGLQIIQHAPQAWGIQFNHSDGSINVHHNVMRDLGTKIANRHGSAMRSIGFRLPKETKQFVIHHNLIQRARQNAISHAHAMHNNEIYVDSWSTNSFAIQPHSEPGLDAGEHYENRIFATGFNPYGFGWAHENLKIRDNFICMFGLDVKHRWDEKWGDINMLAGIRVTNYGKGGQVRNNLEYSGNLILMKGKDGCELQGTRFYSDVSIEGLAFHDNIVKVESLDERTQKVAPIVAQGHYNKLDSKPIYYRNNKLISNLVLVQFGDSYGKGNNHQFESCTFTRIGGRKDFRTFGFGGGFFNVGHSITDGKFEGGAAVDDVRWEETSSFSSYEVRWTLTVATEPGAAVEIRDRDGHVVANGAAGADGKFVAAVAQCTVRPMEWTPSDSPTSLRAATRKTEHQTVDKSPHSVSVKINGREVTKSVTVDAAKTLEVR
jgi:hypothetical protein